MNILGFITECNPLHNGHVKLFNSKEADLKIATISSAFTQRGVASIVPKSTRTRALLSCGIDIVIELPLPFSIGNAETFAKGSISMLSLAGVNELVFGSERGDIGFLKRMAEALSLTQTKEEITHEIKSNDLSYPQACAKVLGEIDKELESSIAQPNNILGVEYLKAMNKYPKIKASTIHRGEGSAQEPSATALRDYIMTGGIDLIKAYMPSNVHTLISNAVKNGHTPRESRYNATLFGALITVKDETVLETPSGTNGLAERFIKLRRDAHNLNDLINALKSKQYTDSRIRRFLLECAFAISKKDYGFYYIRVLGLNDRGASYLKELNKNSNIPFATAPSMIDYNDITRRQYDLRIEEEQFYHAICQNHNFDDPFTIFEG